MRMKQERTQPDSPQSPDQGRLPARNRPGVGDVPEKAGRTAPAGTPPDDRDLDDDHEGATEDEVDDRSGPGVGYDQEPTQEKDRGR